jgi:hypothetical protein
MTGRSQTLPWWLERRRGKDDRKQNTLVRVGVAHVRDLTRDGRWSTYVVSVHKKMGGNMLPSPTNLARLGHFPPASQAWHLAGPVFKTRCIFSLSACA